MVKRTSSLTDVLDATFERIKKIDTAEFELRADFSRYLCVLVSGYLEQSLRNATAEYIRSRSQPTIANFVIKTTGRISNLKTEKITDHLLSFNTSWEEPLKTLLADEAKDAINSVVALRHGIAHGQP